MKVTLLCDHSLQCGEGPYWEPNTKSLFWTESAGATIYIHNKKQRCSVWKEGIHVASITGHASGGLMCCGSKGFYHINENGSIRMVADSCEGKPLTSINEIIADAKGRVFGGQESYKENEKYDTGSLYMVDTNGDVTIKEEGLHISNGMGFSNDMRIFYLTDTILGVIYMYDYNVINGDLKNKRVLAKIDRNDGLPDGLTVDAEGFIWIARWFGGGLSRYDPDGKLERKIHLPFTQPTSLTFGGKDNNEIYITSAAIEWATKLAPSLHQYHLYRGGGVYKIIQDIEGRPEYKAKV